MKNKLGYLLMVLLVLAACRTDHLQEEKARNEASESLLRSKIISLNESVHKNKLQPYLIDMKEKIKHKSKQDINALGRIINYGDSISIDTDEVIYIEYKSYHTYTFKIKRNGSEGNAPVENLILSLEPDGSYKELMKTYNFSEDDFYELSRGNGIDLKGKSYTVELEKGTFVSASQARSFCHYESQTIIRVCKSTDHHANNINDWHKCDYIGNDAPKIFTIEILVCEEDSNAIMGGWDVNQPPNSYTGGGDPISGGNNNPQPENPNDVEDAQNELGGVISTPNLGIPHPNDTPCAKTKVLVNKPKIKDTIAAYKAFALTSQRKEKGILEHQSGTLIPGVVEKDLRVSFGYGFTTVGTIHVHPLQGIAMFSPKDLVNFVKHLRFLNATTINNAYAGMISASGNYFITYTGTEADLPFNIPFNMPPLDYFNMVKDLNREYYKLVDKIRKSEGKPEGTQLSQQGRERLFFEMMKLMGLDGKVKLTKEENGTVFNVSEGINGNPSTSTPCN